MQWNNGTPNLLAEIQATLNDTRFNTSGGDDTYLLPWANRVVDIINDEIGEDNPYLYAETVLAFTTNQAYVLLPSDFNFLASEPVANGTRLTPETLADSHRVDPWDKSVGDWPTRYSIGGFDVANAYTVGSATQVTGSGLSDLTPGGTHTYPLQMTYKVVIDAAAGTDTFKWSMDGGTTYEATGVAMTGSAQTLANGVTITWGATTGHTLNDAWTFIAYGEGQLKMNLNNIPDGVSTTWKVTGTDSNVYNPTTNTAHISDNTNKPITGANYASYWTASSGTASTWKPGKLYGYGVAIPYYKRVVPMNKTTDTPSGIPPQFHHVVVEGVCYIAYRWLNELEVKNSDIVNHLSTGIQQIKRYLNRIRVDEVTVEPRYDY